jgi:hypothetical protein
MLAEIGEMPRGGVYKLEDVCVPVYILAKVGKRWGNRSILRTCPDKWLRSHSAKKQLEPRTFLMFADYESFSPYKCTVSP